MKNILIILLIALASILICPLPFVAAWYCLESGAGDPNYTGIAVVLAFLGSLLTWLALTILYWRFQVLGGLEDVGRTDGY